MSKDDLPDIPSWEELGISPEELKELEEELEKGESAEAASATDPPQAETAEKPTKAKAPSARETRKARKQERKAAKAAESASKEAGPDAGPGPAGAPPAPEPAKAAPPAGGTLRGPLTAVVLCVVAWGVSSYRAPPSPLGANAPDSVFAADRAMVHMENIARAAHPPGSPEHTRVREYLLTELRSMGLQPTVQTTTEVIQRNSFARAVTVRNVLARIPGSGTTGTVLLTAHYDGREIAHAAGDDASGVATILESLRALSTGEPLRNDVMVLITDAEELGLLGARAFVNQHPWMDEVTLVISVEMRGGGGPSVMFETGADNGWIIDQLKAGDPEAFANSLTYEVYKQLPNDTDFTPFKEAGKQGLNFAGIANAHVYHQVYDTPENFSRSTLQHHGVNMLSMLRHLGRLELGTISAPDKIYFSVPFLGLITYARIWAYVLSGLLLLLAIVGWAYVRRAGARVSGILVGTLAGVVTMGAAAGLGLALLRLLPRFHQETGQLHGSLFHVEGWYVAGLAAGAVAVTTLVFGVLKRWYSLAELAAGAVVVPVLAAVAVGAWRPYAGMNLQWPALAGILAVGVVAGVGRGERPGIVRWALLAILALPVLALLTPLTELLWLAMNFSLAPYLAVLVVLALLLLLPLLDIVREPNGWWTTVAATVAAVALVGVGILNAGPSADRPAPSTLLYAVDRESNESVWLTDADDAPSSGERARSWARERVGEPEGEWSALPFLGREISYATAAAPMRPLRGPSAAIVPDTTGGGAPLRLAFRSELGAEMLLFRVPEDAPLLTAVNGIALDSSEPIRVLEHWGEPNGSVLLDFAAATGDSVSLDVVEHHFRPAEIVGPEPFRRPADLAPNVRRLSDRAMIRSPVLVRGDTVIVAGGPAVEPEAVPEVVPEVVPDITVEEPAPAQTTDSSAVADTAAAQPDSVAVPPDTVVQAPQSDTIPSAYD